VGSMDRKGAVEKNFQDYRIAIDGAIKFTSINVSIIVGAFFLNNPIKPRRDLIEQFRDSPEPLYPRKLGIGPMAPIAKLRIERKVNRRHVINRRQPVVRPPPRHWGKAFEIN